MSIHQMGRARKKDIGQIAVDARLQAQEMSKIAAQENARAKNLAEAHGRIAAQYTSDTVEWERRRMQYLTVTLTACLASALNIAYLWLR